MARELHFPATKSSWLQVGLFSRKSMCPKTLPSCTEAQNKKASCTNQLKEKDIRFPVPIRELYTSNCLAQSFGYFGPTTKWSLVVFLRQREWSVRALLQSQTCQQPTLVVRARSSPGILRLAGEGKPSQKKGETW